MNLPIIITNFKAYESAVGKKALDLAKIHEKVARETGAAIAIAVQAYDIYLVSRAVSIPVFAQHVDEVTYGSATGHVLAEGVKEAGAYGTLVNHSECRTGMERLPRIIARAKEVGLYTIVCAETPEEGAEIAGFDPNLIAIEPPELIGGDISVSTARPEVISGAVELIGERKVLVGAGVKNAEDVRTAMHLGAVGILLASGITKADDPEAVLRDLVSGFS